MLFRLTLIMAGSHSDQITQWTLCFWQLCTQASGSTSHGRPALAVPPAHAAAAAVSGAAATVRALANMAVCTVALDRQRSSSAALRCLAVGSWGRTEIENRSMERSTLARYASTWYHVLLVESIARSARCAAQRHLTATRPRDGNYQLVDFAAARHVE